MDKTQEEQEIEKKISQYQNRQKILLNKKRTEMASARCSNSSSSAASSISRIIKSSGDCTRNMAWFSMPGLQSIE